LKRESLVEAWCAKKLKAHRLGRYYRRGTMLQSRVGTWAAAGQDILQSYHGSAARHVKSACRADCTLDHDGKWQQHAKTTTMVKSQRTISNRPSQYQEVSKSANMQKSQGPEIATSFSGMGQCANSLKQR
jgi:hypothetical protein